MKNIVIFGAGSSGELAARFMNRSRNSQVIAFADNDEVKSGQTFLNIPIIKPGELKHTPYDHILVASMYAREIVVQLEVMGVPTDRFSIFDPDGKLSGGEIRFDETQPRVLVLTDEAISASHGVGAVLLRHLKEYPSGNLIHGFLRDRGDIQMQPSYQLVNPTYQDSPCIEDSGLSGAGLACRLAAENSIPDIIYANFCGDEGLEVLLEFCRGLPRPVPVIQHFHDLLIRDTRRFPSILRDCLSVVSEFWAIGDAIARAVKVELNCDVRIMNTFKCDLPSLPKSCHREYNSGFKTIMLGNCHLPWTLKYLGEQWRLLRDEMPGLEPIQWICHPSSLQRVMSSGVSLGQEIEYYGFLGEKVLKKTLHEADLALVPFNITDEAENDYARYSIPSRLTEFMSMGLPIFMAAGKGTDARMFVEKYKVAESEALINTDAFRRKLRALILDSRQRAELGQRARNHAESHCDIRVYRKELIECFQRLISEDRSNKR